MQTSVYVCPGGETTTISETNPDGVDKPEALTPTGVTETENVNIIVNPDNPGSETFVPMKVTITVTNVNVITILNKEGNVIKEV